MKVKVNKQLSAGAYHVNFEVSDFTAEELAKMSAFGIPTIQLEWVNSSGVRTTSAVAINAIAKRYDASFQNEESAKKYEQIVLNQIKAAIERLRLSKDDFSGSQEVEF